MSIILADELNTVQIELPSETVFKYTGAYGVSEPAALIIQWSRTVALVKKKSGNVTISVARYSLLERRLTQVSEEESSLPEQEVVLEKQR